MDFLDKLKKEPGNARFLLVTQDFSGLGFAKRFQDEGADVLLVCAPKEGEDSEHYDQVADGLLEREDLADLWEHRGEYKNDYWIWDGNHHSKEADQLRAEGFARVFGGHGLTDKMEHDRKFGEELIRKAGLEVPETSEHTDIDSALQLLDENPDKAYVFKPDEPDEEAWTTTCPSHEVDHKANRELYKFLISFSDAPSSFVLQERKSGVELNVEMFLHKGKPFFAHANYECKRKYNGDLGKMTGCAQDIEFVIPLDCRILRDTLWKLVALPEFRDYTGFLDLNLIVGDNQYWFLEFCARFGYNATPNLMFNLAIRPVSQIFRDFIDGNVADFGKGFRSGFGASITMTIDEPVCGMPLIVPETLEKDFYHYDSYHDGEDYRLSGYAHETGIVMGFDYDLKSAADNALENLKRVYYPGKAARTDINQTDYLMNPWERHIAAKEMKLFDA